MRHFWRYNEAPASLHFRPSYLAGLLLKLDMSANDSSNELPALDSARFREIVNALPVAIYTTDAAGRLTYFNQACVEFSGRTPELGTDHWCVTWKLYHPDGTPMPHDQCPMAVSLKERRAVRGVEAIAERPDGTRIWFEAYPMPFFDAAGNLSGGVNMLVDITERKQADAKLHQELEHTQLLQRLSADLAKPHELTSFCETLMDAAVAIMRSDFASMQIYHPERGTSGELHLLGHRGFTPEAARAWEWVGADHATTCGIAFRTGTRCVVADVEACDWMAGSEDLAAYRETGIRSVQSTPLNSRSGARLGMISTHWRQPHEPTERDWRMFDVLARYAADLIERQQAERGRATLAAIVETSDDAIITKNLDGVITSWNKSAERIFGYTAAEAVGKPVTILIPEGRQHEEPAILTRLRRGERVDHFETIRIRKDGTLLDISLTISPVKDNTGQIVGVSKIARDITDRKRAEQALQDADRKKNEFIATLAHELRNPLAPIRNSIHILRLAGTEDASTQRIHEMMERQVAHMSRLVEDLLDIARITSGKITLRPEPIEVAAIIRGAVELSKPLVDAANHRLATTLPASPLTVEGDLVRLTQVVANLLNNAAKYMEPGGQIWLNVTSADGQAVISVRDTGIGIAPDVLPRVFQMFDQGDRDGKLAQGGLGVGLALAKRLVEMHGGQVEGKSAGRGQGSEFTIRLPLAKKQLPAAPAPPAAADQATRATRILIVDDNQDGATSLGMLLKMLGNEVRTVNDGPAALALLETYSPTVVLLDLGMPGMNGYEVARHARALPTCKDTVIIALTGWGQEEDRRRTREAGFDHHLLKPVNIGTLKILLTEVRGRSSVP